MFATVYIVHPKFFLILQYSGSIAAKLDTCEARIFLQEGFPMKVSERHTVSFSDGRAFLSVFPLICSARKSMLQSGSRYWNPSSDARCLRL